MTFQTLEAMVQDMRYGARLLRRSPVFTLVAVASLAFGLGGGVALFGFMNAVLFRPLPGNDTREIYAINTSQSGGSQYGSTSYADFQSFVGSAHDLLAGSCATTNVRGNVRVGRQTESVPGAIVSGGCFDALRLSPHLGRLLNRSDEQATNGSTAVVISYTFWQHAFAGAPDAVGREILLNGASATIVGVAARGFAGLSLDSGAEFWAPAPLGDVLLTPGTLTNRGARRFRTYVRLADGADVAQLTARLSTVAAQLRIEDAQSWIDRRGATRRVTVLRELDSRLATNPGAAAGIGTSLLGAISVIVALACVNLATMVMARGAARTYEFNVRLALGASRMRLLRQLATESLLISVMGAATGLAVVAILLKLLDVFRPPELPAFNLAIDWRVISFATFAAILTPLLFGLGPGVHALRLAIAEGLKSTAPLVRRRWFRAGAREVLLAVQVTVSFGLLVTAALFTRGLMTVSDSQPAALTSSTTLMPVDLGPAAYSDAATRDVTARLFRAAATAPGVERSTAASIVPVMGSSIGVAVRLPDRPDEPEMVFDANIVAPGYFDLTGVRLSAGRDFDDRDHDRAPGAAIVSEALARRLWRSTVAVGRTLQVDDVAVEVVGIVANTPYRTYADSEAAVIYLPIAQAPQRRFVLHLRVVDGPEGIVTLDRALRTVDPRIAIGPAMSMQRYLDQVKIGARVTQWGGGLAAVLQLALALMALWGLVAYAVQRRTAEIGIRLALGATRASIVHLVVRPSLLVAAIGLVNGGIAGVAAGEVLHSQFLGIGPFDLMLVIPATVAFAAVVAAAAWLPARRASMIDPASALRQL
jgi:putative ABC transport system permease protein